MKYLKQTTLIISYTKDTINNIPNQFGKDQQEQHPCSLPKQDGSSKLKIEQQGYSN